jgi:transposase-like protein
MPIPRRVTPKTPPIGQRRCPVCGLPLFLMRINPTDKADEDERFECTDCAYAETVTVQFGNAYQ